MAELGKRLVELQAGIDALAGVAARWVDTFETAGGCEDAGAPTLAAWARRELRLTPAESRRYQRAGHALASLPATRDALQRGEIRAAHVDAIAAGEHQLGVAVIGGYEPVLLDVARTCDPAALRQAVDKVRDVLDPEAAEAAYLRALERRDVTVSQVGDGFALGGFLDPETGSLLQRVLYSGSKPTSSDDDRTAGQRRVDALRDLCRAAADHGLPSDRGMRPHLFVTVTADRLDAVTQTRAGHPTDLADTHTAALEPADLTGFGPIPDSLLSRIACDCTITPVIVDAAGPHPHVLDVGRTQRLATMKQRQAIWVQQGGACFNPGCGRTNLEIHHLVPWSVGGETNLADLRGYCTRCHHLIHQGLLLVRSEPGGGWTHRTRHGSSLIDRPRIGRRRSSTYTRDLLAGGLDHARAQHERWRQGKPSQPPPVSTRC